jgi:cob(I)alamin adenosyltransferase
MIHVYTGNGKGKTTAALGLVMRTLGYNRMVCIVQFMKPDDHWGEIRFLDQQPNVMLFNGAGRFVDRTPKPETGDAQARADRARKRCAPGTLAWWC